MKYEVRRIPLLFGALDRTCSSNSYLRATSDHLEETYFKFRRGVFSQFYFHIFETETSVRKATSCNISWQCCLERNRGGYFVIVLVVVVGKRF